MANNEKKWSNSSIIRMVIYIITMILLLLGIFKVIPKEVTMPVSSIILIATITWNGIECIKNKDKKGAIFQFVMCGLLVILLIGYFFGAVK